MPGGGLHSPPGFSLEVLPLSDPVLYSFHPAAVIVPPERQRSDLPNIEDLMASISQVGQLQPILVTGTPNGVATLVAGGRRLEACRRLDINVVAVFVEDADPEWRELAELEENVKREDLNWLDRANAIRRATLLLKDRGVTTLDEIAARLSISTTVVKRNLFVAKEYATNPTNKVFALPGMDTAYNELARQLDRKTDNELEQVRRASPTPNIIRATGLPSVVPLPGPNLIPEIAPRSLPFGPIVCISFLDWVASYTGPRFNLIHCDFPYGVNATAGGQISAALEARPSYDDSEDVYWNLLSAFLQHSDRFIAESAHVIFWFSMKHYTRTVEAFRAADFTVNPHPLVWLKSDNAGILQDYNRVYRNIYETALFITRGDRKLVRAKSNAIAHPRGNTEAHISAKPVPVLKAFLEGVTDSNSFCFDPTCGSGNALIAATELGAGTVVGLEIDPEIAEASNIRYLAAMED